MRPIFQITAISAALLFVLTSSSCSAGINAGEGDDFTDTAVSVTEGVVDSVSIGAELSGIELTRALLAALELDGDRSLYTADSLAVYDEARSLASGVIANYTDEEKRYLLSEIAPAKSALVLKTDLEALTGADLTHLLEETAKLDFDKSYYTKESLAKFNDALSLMGNEPSSYTDEEKNLLIDEFNAAKQKLVFIAGDLPRVYISTDGWIGREYGDARVAVVDASGGKYKTVADTECIIRVRGNSTSGAPKKPYNFKFADGRSILGMDKGRRWVLLANAFDKTLLRNKMMFDFSQAVGIPCASDSRFAEVWIDGVYSGNYVLCEPVTDGGGRVDIDTETGTEVILELNLGGNIVTPCGVPLYIHRPENAPGSITNYVQNFTDELDARLYAGDVAEIEKMMDVDSFISLYLMMELYKNVDGYWASTYFWIKDGVIHAGPPWDFDLSCGNVNPYNAEDKYYTYCNVNGFGDNTEDSTHGFWMNQGWFALMLDIKELRTRIVERYIEWQPLIENLYKDNELGGNVIDKWLDECGDSFLNDYDEDGAGWDINANYSPYERRFSRGISYFDHVEYFREWMKDRNEWLMEHFLELDW